MKYSQSTELAIDSMFYMAAHPEATDFSVEQVAQAWALKATCRTRWWLLRRPESSRRSGARESDGTCGSSPGPTIVTTPVRVSGNSQVLCRFCQRGPL